METNLGYLGVSPPISISGPSKLEEAATEKLMKELKLQGAFESEEISLRRERILRMVNSLVKSLVRRASLNIGMSEQAAGEAGGKIFPFGSYRLGVHGPKSDLNILCVAPQHVTYTDFFWTFEPMLKESEGVSEVVGVPDAHVPIIKAEIYGITIHFSFASLNQPNISEDLELDDDRILAGLDERFVRSLGGTRVGNEILRLVPNQAVFRDSLRCIRLWAQRRAIYSSVNRFLGGIDWAILVARICQLYPNLNAAATIHRFFNIMLQWEWPQPVLLRQIEGCMAHVNHGQRPNLRVWDPRLYPADRKNLMPIITPAYPSACSARGVTRSTLSVMKDEFLRGSQIVEMIVTRRAQWSELFAEHDFFQKYRNYVQVIASSRTHHNQLRWSGTVESKLRQLAMKLERVDQLEVVHPFITGFHQKYYCVDEVEARAIAQGEVPSGVAKRKEEDVKIIPGVNVVHTSTFYIGIKFAGRTGTAGPGLVDISYLTTEFVTQVKEWHEYQEEIYGIVVRNIESSTLPDYVFDAGMRPLFTDLHNRNESH